MEHKTQKSIAEIEAARRRRDGTLFVWVCLAILLFVGAVLAFWCSLSSDVDAGRETMRLDTPAEGVGRAETYADAPVKGAAEVLESAGTILRVFCETDSPLPSWWSPETAEIVYQAEPVKDIASPDWNLNTSIVGWDGHRMEVYEMDLFARIVYLEFNGTEPECINAGIDSILNLWDSGYFGRTIFETLSATAENGSLVYTTYGYVWDWDYDYALLKEIRTICEERFVNGPRYGCHFFQLYGFPFWAQPLYEIDSVYFSTFKEGTR